MKTVFSKNLKRFRKANEFTEQSVADYLGINRTTYDNYESGIREMPFELMCQVASLFGCELDALFSENEEETLDLLLCAFRVDNLEKEDYTQIAKFKKIVMNYLKMSRVLENEAVK